MQLWPFISHSGFLLESRFSDFFKFAIFSTFLQIHFNLLEDKHSFGYFWTPKSTYDICSYFHTCYKLHFKPKKQQNRNSILPDPPTRVHCAMMEFRWRFCEYTRGWHGRFLASKDTREATIVKITSQVQVDNYEIVINFFHIIHNLTWCSAIEHKFTWIYSLLNLWTDKTIHVNLCKKLHNWSQIE